MCVKLPCNVLLFLVPMAYFHCNYKKNTLIMVEIAIFPNVLPRSFYYPNNVPFLYIPILTFHQNEESIPEYSDCRNEN